jgi:hypothetical protein
MTSAMLDRVECGKCGHGEEDVRRRRYRREGKGDESAVERVSEVRYSAGEPFGEGAVIREDTKGEGSDQVAGTSCDNLQLSVFPVIALHWAIEDRRDHLDLVLVRIGQAVEGGRRSNVAP